MKPLGKSIRIFLMDGGQKRLPRGFKWFFNKPHVKYKVSENYRLRTFLSCLIIFSQFELYMSSIIVLDHILVSIEYVTKKYFVDEKCLTN